MWPEFLCGCLVTLCDHFASLCSYFITCDRFASQYGGGYIFCNNFVSLQSCLVWLFDHFSFFVEMSCLFGVFFFLKLFLLAWLTFWQKVSAVCSHWGSDTKNQTSCQSLTLLGEAPVNGQSPSSQCLYHPSGLAPVSEGLRLWTYTKTCADMRRHLTMLTKSSFSALNKCHRWFTRGQERMMPSPQQHVLEP